MAGDDTHSHENNVTDLGNGIVKARREAYAILLVGETGKGKTTFLSLLANVLNGKNPQNYEFFHDRSNEAGGDLNQSQTSSARLYRLTSENGVEVRILDTPGLADTRGPERDEQHKANIARAIEETIPIVNAVIIIANGTEERLGAATDYALTTLSSIFPNTFANNIGIVFTNVATQMFSNFDQNSLPDPLRGLTNNQFLLDNPVALWNKSNKMRNQSTTDKVEFENVVNGAHTKALRELVRLFDWLDSLIPQPTEEIINLHRKSQEIDGRIEDAMTYRPKLVEMNNELTQRNEWYNQNIETMNIYRNRINITRQIWEQVSDDTTNMICGYPQCHSNCIFKVKKSGGKKIVASAILSLPLLPFHPVGYAALNGAVAAASRRNNVPPAGEACSKCGHLSERHYVGESRWSSRYVNDVNQYAQTKYNEAKQYNDFHSNRIVDLNRDIASSVQSMAQEFGLAALLAHSYASLSLMGSFTEPKKKAIKLMELRLRNESDMASAEETKKSLDTMRLKLNVLEGLQQDLETNIRQANMTSN